MPAAVGTRSPPPKKCPVCREAVWQNTNNVHEAWRVYTSHVHRQHPDYARWNRKFPLFYLLALTLFIAFPAGILIASLSNAELLIELSWAAAFGTVLMTLILRTSGKKRFQTEWKLVHSVPTAL